MRGLSAYTFLSLVSAYKQNHYDRVNDWVQSWKSVDWTKTNQVQKLYGGEIDWSKDFSTWWRDEDLDDWSLVPSDVTT